jgi:hypothetical protein
MAHREKYAALTYLLEQRDSLDRSAAIERMLVQEFVIHKGGSSRAFSPRLESRMRSETRILY